MGKPAKLLWLLELEFWWWLVFLTVSRRWEKTWSLLLHVFVGRSSRNIPERARLLFVKLKVSTSCSLVPFPLGTFCALRWLLKCSPPTSALKKCNCPGVGQGKERDKKGNTCQIPFRHPELHKCLIFFLVRTLTGFTVEITSNYLQMDSLKFSNNNK